MVAYRSHLPGLERVVLRYRLPVRFEERRGYRVEFWPDGGRHVVALYRPVTARVGRFFCRRCGLTLDVPSACVAGSCIGGCVH
jgi:hypothetical protein